MSQIECNTLFNKKKVVSSEELVFRASVYAVVKHENTVLVIRTSSTKALEFPGGAIELGEHMQDALRREVQEEAGIEVEVGKFLFFKENFFYHDLTGEAFHSLMFVYECTALSTKLPEAHIDIDGRETEEPLWKEIATLKEQDFAGTDREFFLDLKNSGVL